MAKSFDWDDAQIIIPLNEFKDLKARGLKFIQMQEKIAEENSAILEEKIKEVSRLRFEIDNNGDLCYVYNLDLETNGMTSDDLSAYTYKMEELASILVDKYQDLIYQNNKKNVENLAKNNWVLGLSFWQRFLFLFDPDRRG